MANQYFTCVLDAWRDGTTLYGRMHYYRSGTYTYQDTSFPDPTMNLGGTTYTDTDFGNRVRSGINVGDVYTTTFSRTVSGSGTRTVTFTAGAGLRSDFQGTWSVDVSGFPGTSSPPTGLSCSNIQRLQEGFSATVSLTGWGENNTGTVNRYRELQVWTASSSGLVEPRKYDIASGDSLSSTITVNNSSTRGSLTIVPNTEYTIGVYATNGAQSVGSNRVGNYTTLPPTTTISNVAVTATSADFTYSVPNQGGKYDMTLKYQLDSGSLTTVTTLSGSGTKAGTFTVSGLQPGTTHTVTASLTTSAGEVVSNTVTFTTEAAPVTLYGSVNGQAKKVEKLYGSVEAQVPVYTGTIRSADTAFSAFDGEVFSATPEVQAIQGVISYISGKNDVERGWRLSAVLTDSTVISLIDYYDVDPKSPEYFGLTANYRYTDYTGYVDLTQSTVTRRVAKEITKLYGSVNGQTKLIYEAS